MSTERINILGLKFNNLTYKELLKQLIIRIDNKEKTSVVTANPEILMYAKKNPKYFQTLNHAHFVAPDGIGIVSASHILNTPIKERVPGFELMMGLLEYAHQKQKRVYFLGGQQQVNDKVLEIVKKRWPDLIIAGGHHGYFDYGDPEYITMVKNSKPDIVLVALGFPRQEYWGTEYMKDASYGLVMGIGGSFDVLSGKVKRAPDYIQNWNIEWLYRAFQEPNRYKRIFKTIPNFLFKVFKEKHKKNKREKD